MEVVDICCETVPRFLERKSALLLILKTVNATSAEKWDILLETALKSLVTAVLLLLPSPATDRLFIAKNSATRVEDMATCQKTVVTVKNATSAVRLGT